MEVRIVEKDAIRLIGMSTQTTLQDAGEKLPRLNDSFKERKAEIAGKVDSSLDYAVSIDPLDYKVETDAFTFIIGTEVERIEHLPQGMAAHECPPYIYACVEKTNDSTFEYLLHWVNASDYELAETYSIEEVDHMKGTITLMFPVRLRN
ncbi:GyrI-like domain-containing protein [Paenibacillus spongiae]|uniref:Effector binding domain-containing protein n=1 Tax=Paenibacillus spongiae TaxID=2909671 RepID=A0ABY5SG58_9BACL|nr:effector binding domain-containing protein [Paenibacillus spongiae]UVI32966.1 effector binding domain-containing protein [Paenibacillus spongiae]